MFLEKREIAKSRLSQLSTKDNTNLKAQELHLISLAIDANPKDILDKMFGHLKLQK